MPHEAVNGLPFGASEADLFAMLGRPDQIKQNYTGEVEYQYGDEIYRCLADRLVECTVPDVGRFFVGDVEVLSVFDWLAGCDDMLTRAKFRISASHGIAYDQRDPERGSITLFEKGRWDALLQASPFARAHDEPNATS